MFRSFSALLLIPCTEPSSTVYSSGSFSNFEPGTPSSSVRIEKKRGDVLVSGVSPHTALLRDGTRSICLSESRGGHKFCDVTRALRYSALEIPWTNLCVRKNNIDIRTSFKLVRGLTTSFSLLKIYFFKGLQLLYY